MVFQRQLGGAVAKAGVLVGELAMLSSDLAATFFRPEPVHTPRLWPLVAPAVSKGVPHVKERQIFLPLKAMVFTDQARGVASFLPELPSVRGSSRHQGLVASASVRVGKLRGPKRDARWHAERVRGDCVFKEHAIAC